MNFDWMKRIPKLSELYNFCREAEEFVMARPAISASAGRRAMEYVVRDVYREATGSVGYAETTYEMATDVDFVNHLNNEKVLEAIHTVRKIGNAAAHSGNVAEEDALRALEALHCLTGWYGQRKGALKELPAFIVPKVDRIQEFMRKITPDNFALRIAPYIDLNGNSGWLDALVEADVVCLANLPETPDAMQTEEFFAFLEQFTASKKEHVEQILDLLPLAPATEGEWEKRRNVISKDLLGEIDAYVNAVGEAMPSYSRSKWTRYKEILGTKAGWYLQLAHPNIIPEEKRSGFVVPEVHVDEDSYVPMEEAVVQMLRKVASSGENKAKLLCTKSWCREYLDLKIPALIPKNNSFSSDIRANYSELSLHVGTRNYFYLLHWDKYNLYRLRALSGEVGEALVTLERMADWGFADPDSPAAEYARKRAEAREAEERARAEAIEREAKQRIEKTQQLLQSIDRSSQEISPRTIRETIEGTAHFLQNAKLLTDSDWCNLHIGIEEPVLMRAESVSRLRKKQLSAGKPLTYSGCVVEIGKSQYMVRRMNAREFEVLKAALGQLNPK